MMQSGEVTRAAFAARGGEPPAALVAGRPWLLSTAVAEPGQRRAANVAVIASALVFIAALPFAKQPLMPVWAFIPAYQSALALNDLITAALLFGQFAILRSRGLLLLAGAYVFAGLMAVAHALTFPGLFAPGGLLGAGPQSTAWLYMFWHAGFPLLVLAYALDRDGQGNARPVTGRTRAAIAWSIAGATLAATLLTALATSGQGALPAIMQGNRYTDVMLAVVSTVWLLSMLALGVLWRRRPHTVLDLWLAVVMCAWVFDIGLAAVFNAGRFDLGFYAGRVYGLAAASFVLVVLLLDHSVLYARLARVHEREAGRLAQAQRTLAQHRERLRILHEIDRAVVAQHTPEAIAAAVIGPLRELLGVPRAIVNRFDLEAGEVEWIAAAGRRRMHVGPGVRYSIRLMGEVEALRRGEPQRIDVHALPHGPEREALLASDVHVYMVMPMVAGGELIGALSFGASEGDFPTEQMNIAQEVATQLAIALSQARLHERVRRHAGELERRVVERTEALEAANKELESFSYSVSHDLRAPLRAVDGFAKILEEDYGERLDGEGRRLLGVVRSSSKHMGQLIDDLLDLSRLGRLALGKRPVDMAGLAREVAQELPRGNASVDIGALPACHADPRLLRQVWANLIGNALKYSGKRAGAHVEIGGREEPAESVYWVRDNGVGFDMRYVDKLFGVFQRLHGADEFPGTGVGLAIVQRVVARHGGRVWAEGRPGEGACFHFSVPRSADG
jgi:signal transduction histidine kinase